MSAERALFNKCVRALANTDTIIRRQSSFKLLFVAVFAVFFELGLMLLFLDGLRFMERMGGVGLMMVGRLFSLFFLGMGLMLGVSGIVSAYATMYRSEEVPFLAVRPFRMSQISVYKFLEAAGLSSWAFFFVVVPFVGAYAINDRLSPLFALWTVLFSVPYLVICTGMGALATMVAVRWFPKGRWFKWVVGVGAWLGLLVYIWSVRRVEASEEMVYFNLSMMVPGLSLATNELLPSWWVSEGIHLLSRGQWQRGGMLLGLTVSTALMMVMLVEWLGGLVFYEGWQRVVAGRGAGRRGAILMGFLEKWTSWLPHDLRALGLKDIRTFFRDPMQWSQVLIFFGLLGLYFANIRRFHYHLLPDSWRNTIAFLNVFSVSAVICSLGSRFVYPQLSLEGQCFWMIGLAPTSQRRVLLAKFWTAVSGMLVVSVGLMYLSARMLNAEVLTLWVAVGLAACMSFAVCGLSTGLGAVFMNLEERNPAAIVSGFGGTLNLVLSLGFMLGVILPFGLLFHLELTGRLAEGYVRRGLFCAAGWSLVLTVIFTLVPLVLGQAALRRREY